MIDEVFEGLSLGQNEAFNYNIPKSRINEISDYMEIQKKVDH